MGGGGDSKKFLDSEGLDHYTEYLCEKIRGDRDAIRQQLNALQDYTNESVGDLKELLETTIQETVESINNTIQETVDSLNNTISETVKSLTTTVNDAVSSLNTEMENKADKDFSNVSSGFDYVKETYTSGQSWYRLYNSGWIEQGGYVSSSYDTQQTVTLVYTMSDTNYCVIEGEVGRAESDTCIVTSSLTTTQFQYYRHYSGSAHGSGYMFWYVCGYAG